MQPCSNTNTHTTKRKETQGGKNSHTSKYFFVIIEQWRTAQKRKKRAYECEKQSGCVENGNTTTKGVGGEPKENYYRGCGGAKSAEEQEEAAEEPEKESKKKKQRSR